MTIRERLSRENRLGVFHRDATLLQPLHGMASEVIDRTGGVYTRNDRLGLDASDPRKAQRRQLNSDLLVNYRDYGADHIVDFDVAVRDSSNGSKVAPQYLTSGAPNDAYHMRLAEYLAEAVNDFPPRAEL